MAKKITYLTQEGYDQLVAELNHLIDVDRPQNIEALKEARAQGDLSENADYDAARDEQARIEGRISEIQDANDRLGELSNQKMSALLKKLVDTEKVVKTTDKKVTYFSIAN